MNYRHRYHAGNFADVMKHALLVRLIRALQRKERGFLFVDTHAGRGGYDLASTARGNSQARRPEWPDGIGRLTSSANVPDPLLEYLRLVQEYDRLKGNLAEEPRFYPGSPWLARRLTRPQDRLAFREKNPSEAAALKAAMGRSLRSSLTVGDGYAALRALLPPPERRALVLIDPPFETTDEIDAIAAGCAAALHRLLGCVLAIWYPLTVRAGGERLAAAVCALDPPPVLRAELTIAGGDSDLKMIGCGLVIINPPWQFDRQARTVLECLAPVLARAPGGSAEVSWLVAEG